MLTNDISIGTFSLLDVSKNRSYGKPIEYADETIHYMIYKICASLPLLFNISQGMEQIISEPEGGRPRTEWSQNKRDIRFQRELSNNKGLTVCDWYFEVRIDIRTWEDISSKIMDICDRPSKHAEIE